MSLTSDSKFILSESSAVELLNFNFRHFGRSFAESFDEENKAKYITEHQRNRSPFHGVIFHQLFNARCEGSGELLVNRFHVSCLGR